MFVASLFAGAVRARTVGSGDAAAMVTFNAVAVGIYCLNLLNEYTAMSIATGEAYTRVFGRPASDTLAGLFMDMQQNG